MVDIATFHFEFVELGGCLVMGIGIIPVLDEDLFKFIPDVEVWGSGYWSSHDSIFYTAFSLCNR